MLIFLEVDACHLVLPTVVIRLPWQNEVLVGEDGSVEWEEFSEHVQWEGTDTPTLVAALSSWITGFRALSILLGKIGCDRRISFSFKDLKGNGVGWG